jgi:tetratricopeptide (TPR) repeat protein
MPAAVIADPFREAEVERHLKKASLQADHAATLGYLWPALRQLLGVPYNDSRFAIHRPAWETLAGVWDRSASWYGLHNDTPIGKLAAVNALLWIRAAGTPSHIEPGFARGARASAFYSMAKRLWARSPRRELFLRALDEVQYALQASPKRRSGYLAIRGSVHLKLGRVSAAIADYEAAVAERAVRGDSPSSQGEAWVELGWGYLRALRIRTARQALRHGLTLMRSDFLHNPTLRPDFLIRALMKHALAFALMLDFKEARMSAQEGCRLAHERVASDQLSGIRGRLCRWFTR